MAAYGSGRIYRRGRVWWLQYSAHGRKHRESSGSEVKRDALHLLQLRLVEAQSKAVDERHPTFTLAEVAILQDYRLNGRRSRPEKRLRNLRPVFGKMDLSELGTRQVRSYAAARVREGAAPATVNRELSCLRRMMKLMHQDGLLASVPHFPMLAERNVRKGFIEEDELQCLLPHLPEHVQPIAEFAYVTGWRTAEILSRQWRHVTATSVRLEPGETKNGEGREFPLIPRLKAVIERQAERKGTRFVRPLFFYKSGQPVKSFKGSWDKACDAAGLPGTLFHDLRRTAVRNLVAAGVDRETAKKLTGHLTDSVFTRYDIVDGPRLHREASKLEELYESAPRTMRAIK